jgi:DNA invertase Pin-like site-specific DNA recombinase
MRDNPAVACYVRSSTEKQTVEHQYEDIEAWSEQRDIDPSSIDRYVDLSQSGRDPGREQFETLIEEMEAGAYDYVVIWEVSRLARLGSTYQKFFEVAEASDTIIAITDGWVDEVRPDGTGKLIADISAAVAEEERRRLIKRVNAGVRRARNAGKWLGEVPVGFQRNDEGYLRPIVTPDSDEDSYLESRAALEEIEEGESYRQAAKPLNTTRQTLSRIDQMPDHDTYVEVFGGSAGVLYNKPRSKYEIYNDSNDDLTQFFRVLRNQPEELAKWLQKVPYSRSQYEEWVDEFYAGIRPDDPIIRAGRFFALRYMQYTGLRRLRMASKHALAVPQHVR